MMSYGAGTIYMPAEQEPIKKVRQCGRSGLKIFETSRRTYRYIIDLS